MGGESRMSIRYERRESAAAALARVGVLYTNKNKRASRGAPNALLPLLIPIGCWAKGTLRRHSTRSKCNAYTRRLAALASPVASSISLVCCPVSLHPSVLYTTAAVSSVEISIRPMPLRYTRTPVSCVCVCARLCVARSCLS